MRLSSVVTSMSLVLFSLGLHSVFPYVLHLEGSGIKTTSFHFFTKEDTEAWLNYVIETLRTMPIYDGDAMVGFHVEGNLSKWFSLVRNVSMAIDGEKDCELGYSSPTRDSIYYFNTCSEKLKWIHNGRRRMTTMGL